MDPYFIILADDHALVRQGIKRIIEEAEEFKIIGEVSDGIQLLDLLKKVIPDLIILDISMPNLKGLEATLEIKRMQPKVKILILTMHRNESYLKHALSLGADGYLLKEDADSELLSAIQTVRRGEMYVSPLLSNHSDGYDEQHGGGSHGNQQGHTLTNREREILRLIASGKTNKEVAEALFLSIRTVETHRANLMKKLNLRKTTDLLQYAIKEGYVNLDQ